MNKFVFFMLLVPLSYFRIESSNSYDTQDMSTGTPMLDATKVILSIIAQNPDLQELMPSDEQTQTALQIISSITIDTELQDEINLVVEQASKIIQANILEDLHDIKVAAALSTMLEAINQWFKAMKIQNEPQLFVKELVQAAHSNTIHKLIIGANPGKFSSQKYYTNAYAESLGFTLNNFIIWKIGSILSKSSIGSWIQNNINMDNTPATIKMLAKKISCGILSHFAWTIQKIAFLETV